MRDIFQIAVAIVIALVTQIATPYSSPWWLGMVVAAAVMLYSGIHLFLDWRTRERGILLEPANLIIIGLGGALFFLLIAVAGYTWSVYKEVGPIPQIDAADSPIKTTISEVTFPAVPETQFNVELHLANTGPPSTVKNFVLSAYKNGKLYVQLPPRELGTTPRWGSGSPPTMITPGLILRTDPLQAGQEVDLGINYQTVNNSKNEIGQPGMVLRMVAVDVNGKELAAKYMVQ